MGQSCREKFGRAPRALVFDSGLGGLTVLGEFGRLRPDVDIVYVADDAAFPYGGLGEAERVARVETVMARVIADHRPDTVVVVQHRLDAGSATPARGLSSTVRRRGAGDQAGGQGFGFRAHQRAGDPRDGRSDYTQALVRDHAANCEVMLVGSAKLAPIAERAMRGDVVDDPKSHTRLRPASSRRAEDARITSSSPAPTFPC
jgi:glutamate racemase